MGGRVGANVSFDCFDWLFQVMDTTRLETRENGNNERHSTKILLGRLDDTK